MYEICLLGLEVLNYRVLIMERRHFNFGDLNRRRQCLIRLDLQRRRLHEWIGREGAEVRPDSWENVLRIGRVKAKIANSVGRISQNIEVTEEEIESERQRLVAKARIFDQELNERSRVIAARTDLVNKGFLSENKYAEELSKYREFKADPEIVVGKKLLKDQLKRESRGRNLKPVLANLGGERLKDEVIYVNEELRAAAVGGREVRFDEGLEWEAFKILAVANQSNRFSPNGQFVSSREINESVIRPIGGGVSAIRLIENIRERSEVVLRGGVHQVTEQSFPLKELIETRQKGGGTDHRLVGRVVFFAGPERILVFNTNAGESNSKNPPVSLEQYAATRRRREEVLKRDSTFNEHVQELVDVYDQSVREGKLPPDNLASLAQVVSVFSGLTIDFIWEMQERGLITPAMRRKGDTHPGFSKAEIVYLAYLRRYGLQLSLPKNLANELHLLVSSKVKNSDLNNSASK